MKCFFASVAALAVAGGLLAAPVAEAAAPKITYKVWTQSDSTRVGRISYDDHQGLPQSVDEITAPWSLDLVWPYKDKVMQVTAIQSANHVYCQILVEGHAVAANNGNKSVNCRYQLP